MSWRQPWSRHWHQLDLVITRRADLSSVLHTRSYQSSDCDTDHSLVTSKVRLMSRKIHHSKTACGTSDPFKAPSFADSLQEKLAAQPTTSNPDARWSHLHDAIYDSAMSAFGKKERKKECSQSRRPRGKRRWLTSRTVPQVHATNLRAARSKVQQTTRHCANEYWQNLCAKIQLAADCGHAKGMYEGIKTATGPTSVKTAPLKSKTDQSMPLQRWVKHYPELYSTQNIVTDSALNALPGLPVIEELDNTPTLEELSIAIDGLACGKAPGKDGIPTETMLQPLHELLCLCWEQGHIPQDMRDANIVTLYKNNGDLSDCNNYRGISLLSIVSKVFARVTLARLQSLASQVYPESQCGFRAGRSTVDMIFSLRLL